MIMKGNVCGVAVFGDCNEFKANQMVGVAEAISKLEKQLTGLFNEQFSQSIIKRLGTTDFSLVSGNAPEADMKAYQELFEMGLVYKDESPEANA